MDRIFGFGPNNPGSNPGRLILTLNTQSPCLYVHTSQTHLSDVDTYTSTHQNIYKTM